MNSLVVALEFRDLQQVDLGLLEWSGGSAHMDALALALRHSWEGLVEALVGEVSTGALIAAGGVDYRLSSGSAPDEPASGVLWMLSVHPSWQGLGVGTQLIAALEDRARQRGCHTAALAVEHDNPRAAALYRRLGYTDFGSGLDTWPLDDGSTYVTAVTHMHRSLREPSRA